MSVSNKSLLHRFNLRNFSFVIIIPICLLLTVIAFNQTREWEHQRIQAGFEGAAQNRFSALEREIESNLETLLALQALYSTSPSITRSQFRDFVGPLLSHHPSIQALEWIPLVTDSQRGKYEAAAKKEGLSNFEITERPPQGKVIRASKRKEYFPVYFVEPIKGNKAALGFDLASNPTRLEALNLSREIGEMVATGRVTLVQEIGRQFGFLVFLPIYRDDSADSTQVPRKTLKGFVLGVFRVGDILEKSLTYLEPEGVNIYLYDKIASEEERFLYFHNARPKTRVSSLMSGERDEPKPGKSIEYSKTLGFANREWEIRYTPTPEYITASRSWQPWGVLAGGLLLAGLLATYFMNSRKRTDELLKSNEQLRLEIDERQRAEEALQRSEKGARRLAEENAIMAEIGRIVSSSLSIEEIYKKFSEEVKKLIFFDRISINLIDANKDLVLNQYVEGISPPERVQGNSFPVEGTATGAVIKSRKGLILDIQDEKEIGAEFPGLLPEARAGLRSFLSVPLISGDRTIGALHLRSRECKAYSERDLRVAENIAHQITGPLANAQLFNDLKSTAEALRRSEILLRNVLDLLPVGVGIADKNGKITSINPARERIWEGAKIVGIDQYKEFKGWWRDTGKKIEAEEWPLARAVIRGEISIEKEIDIECFDGARKTMLNWAVPIRDANHGIIGAIAVNQDITERKQAEERLRHSEEHFRSLIENSSDMIIEVDKNGVIFYISPSAERILGYKANSLIGKNAFEFIHPDDLPRTREAFGYLYQNPGIIKALEYRLRHADGSWRIFQSFRKVVSEDGRNPVVIINSRDITEQKNLESQLVQAQKLESIGQLAAGIAHEINTPTQYVGDNTRFFNDAFKDLNRLLGKYGQLFQTIKNGAPLDGTLQEIEGIVKEIDLAYLTDEIPRAIQQTLEGVERVRTIVQAMKEFSHPGTKEKTPIDLNKAIQNTITVARNEWKYVAEMATDFDPSLPLVSGLPGELNQVILNMIINAAHAIADVVGDGSKGKGTITVSTRQNGNWAEIRVSDTGTGIPENIRSRIFDPFFTTKKVGKGTGQGLTISHSVIVDKHGGTIHFDTEMGKGTTFIIRLPMEDGAGS